jgi:hypothetical protein
MVDTRERTYCVRRFFSAALSSTLRVSIASANMACAGDVKTIELISI